MHPQAKLAPTPSVGSMDAWGVRSPASGLYLPNDAVPSQSGRTQQPGRCQLFDGVDSWIDLGNQSALDFVTSFSLSVWVTSTALNTYNYILAKYGTDKGWDLYTHSSGRVYFVVRGASSIVGYTPDETIAADGAWHHLVAVATPTSVQVYHNGIPLAMTGGTGTWTPTTAADSVACIGARKNEAGGAEQFWTGKIFDARAYSRALTASEAMAIYRSSLPGNKPHDYLYLSNLVGHWKLDDDYQDHFRDSSGNDLHGTGSGFTYPTAKHSGSDVPFSWKNEVGYTGTVGAVTDSPASDADPSRDVDGNLLEFPGRVSRDALLIDSACGHFDGGNDRAALATRLTSGTITKLSMSAWVLRDTSNTSDTICGEYMSTPTADRSWRWWLYSDGKLYLTTSANGTVFLSAGSTGTVTADATWHHVATTYDGTASPMVTHYIDGVATGTGDVNATAYDSVAVFRVGAYNVASDPYDGKIAGLNVWQGVVLTPTEIASLAENVMPTAAPIGSWPMAEGYGSALYDVSGNGKHLTAESIVEGDFWDTVQDIFHYNMTHGFSQPGGADTVRIPAKLNGSSDAAGNPIGWPAGPWHNSAETDLDFTANVATPWSVTRYRSYMTLDGATGAGDVSTLLDGANLGASMSLYARLNKADTSADYMLALLLPGANHQTCAFFGYPVFYNTVDSYWTPAPEVDISGNWVEVLYAMSGTSWNIYINGVLYEGTSSVAFNPDRPGDCTDIGLFEHYNSGSSWLAADISRLVLTNSLETPGSVLSSGSKLLDYRFDNPRVLIDYSGNGRHVVVPSSGWTFPKVALPTDYAHGDSLPAGMSKTTDALGREKRYRLDVP